MTIGPTTFLDQAVLVGEDGDLDPVTQGQLAQDGVDVGLDLDALANNGAGEFRV